MKHLKTLILISFIILSSCYAYGQRKGPGEEKEIKLAVKWSPLHLVSFFPTLQLDLEHRIAHNYSIQYEGGLALGYPRGENSHFRGFKVSVEARRHFFPKSYRHYYLAGQVFYNRINYMQKDLFATHPELDQQSEGFFQTMYYGMRYRDAGFVMKVGLMKTIGKFCIDMHFGTSISYVDDYSINKPQYSTYRDYYPGDGDIVKDITRIDEHTSLHPTLGIRIGYIIR